jgi:tetratricopeptide (TPR) repeat protein
MVGIGAVAGSVGWAARDRAARQAAVEQEASRALDDAERWIELEKWPEALDAVKRGQGVMAGSGGEIRDRLRELRKDLEILIRLENVRLLVTELQSGWHEWDAVHDGYARAFADFGIDVLKLSAEEAAARIRARGRLAVPLAVTLDLWACTNTPRTQENGARLRSVAGLVDPDPWRRQVREAVQNRDGAALARLADSPDLVRQSRDSLAVLQAGLLISGQGEKSFDVLRLSQLTYPGDFWATYWLAHGLYWSPQPDADEVVSFARAAVATRPNGAGAHLLLGVALQRRGKYDEAAAHLRKAVELAPTNPFAHHDLGWTLRLQGKYDEAIACFRKAIDLWPENPFAYCFLGHTLIKQEKSVEALEAFRKALEYHPKPDQRGSIKGHRQQVATIHHGLALALRMEGRCDEALVHHDKSIEITPEDPYAHHDRGWTLHLQGKYDEAMACYRRSIDLWPENPYAEGFRAYTLLAQGKPVEAIAAFRKAARLKPSDTNAQFQLGNALLREKKYDEAVAAYRAALKLDPKHAGAYSGLGRVLYQEGQLDEALAALNKALAIDPQHAPVHNSLAWLLATAPDANVRNPARAVELARRTVDVAPEQGDFWNTLGAAHYRAGDWKAAITALEKSMALRQGGDCSNWFFLAMAHWQLGEKEKAREWYDRAVEWTNKHKLDDEELRRFRTEAAELLGVAGGGDKIAPPPRVKK